MSQSTASGCSLTSGGDRPDYLEALRLQNLERLGLRVLEEMAGRAGNPKLVRAARNVAKLAREEAGGLHP